MAFLRHRPVYRAWHHPDRLSLREQFILWHCACDPNSGVCSCHTNAEPAFVAAAFDLHPKLDREPNANRSTCRCNRCNTRGCHHWWRHWWLRRPRPRRLWRLLRPRSSQAEAGPRNQSAWPLSPSAAIRGCRLQARPVSQPALLSHFNLAGACYPINHRHVAQPLSSPETVVRHSPSSHPSELSATTAAADVTKR